MMPDALRMRRVSPYRQEQQSTRLLRIVESYMELGKPAEPALLPGSRRITSGPKVGL